MYTNDDLNGAVEQGIFTQDSVETFRDYISEQKETKTVDEENFKLLTGFNDIFVVIASILLLSSAGWIASAVGSRFSAGVVALIAWGLSEFFVGKRKMPLPAIVLLLVFVASIFKLFYIEPTYSSIEETGSIFAFAMAGVATIFHWKRFAVPITIAIGMGVVTLFLISSFIDMFPDSKEYIAFVIFLIGIGVFLVAMYWDMQDRKRVSNHSHVAFWLHLLASPLIIHSLFLGLGVFDNNIGSFALFSILFAYVLLSIISLTIERRALMVSSLLYVLYALKTLFTEYGFEGYGLSLGGVIIGLGLLFLTAFWTKARATVVGYMPSFIQLKVPVV